MEIERSQIIGCCSITKEVDGVKFEKAFTPGQFEELKEFSPDLFEEVAAEWTPKIIKAWEETQAENAMPEPEQHPQLPTLQEQITQQADVIEYLLLGGV